VEIIWTHEGRNNRMLEKNTSLEASYTIDFMEYYFGYQLEEDGMSCACSTNRSGERFVQKFIRKS
jgi:hypothetical protein